ncbi:hypothetical protein PABG_11391 [Paracoccidioides brasiliensis Pb03]|nr:hypothetical protein PABG_11391 [Paracoccidioides brasiliensis Pb03]
MRKNAAVDVSGQALTITPVGKGTSAGGQRKSREFGELILAHFRIARSRLSGVEIPTSSFVVSLQTTSKSNVFCSQSKEIRPRISDLYM